LNRIRSYRHVCGHTALANKQPVAPGLMRTRWRAVLAVTALWNCIGLTAAANDPLVLVTRETAAGRSEVSGRLLVTAADGGVLIETLDLQLVTIPAPELVEVTTTDDPFTPWDAETLAAELQTEFGEGFEIVRTRRYVIVSNAGKVYAEWCGTLLERLHTAFLGYWRSARLELASPDYPLVAVIFATREQYAAYAVADAGDALAQSQGYYSVRTNRMVLANLLGDETAAAPRTAGEMQRQAESSVANLVTVVHEATHQIAFNSGLHTRYADNPMWLTEGLAMFCEAPDLQSPTGWRTIGRVHPGRLAQFQDYARSRRGANSLATLLANEDRFRDPATIADAYAESWALTTFLIRHHRREYIAYLRTISAKPRLIWNSEEDRLREFAAAFGEDLDALEAEFLRESAKLRAR
jgi:hypothetical protein